MHAVTVTLVGTSVAEIASQAANIATSTTAPGGGYPNSISCGNGTPFAVTIANETTGAIRFESTGYWGLSADYGTATKNALVINVDNQQAPRTSCGDCGNPITPLTATKHEETLTDIVIGGVPVSLTYDTSLRAPLSAGGKLPDNPNPRGLGNLWASTLHRRLWLQGNTTLAGALVARGDGSVTSFRDYVSPGFATDADNNDRLLTAGTGFRYIDASAGAEETYDASGNLTTLSFANGNVITFTYSTPGTPSVPPAMPVQYWTFGPHTYCWGVHAVTSTLTGATVANVAAQAAAVATSTTAPGGQGPNSIACGNGVPFAVTIANETNGQLRFESNGYWGLSADYGTAVPTYATMLPYISNPVAPEPSYLLQAQDLQGRTVKYSYTRPAIGGVGQLLQIGDVGGRPINLAYDAAGNLSTLQWPDGSKRTFVYESASLPWAMTGIVDENNARYATFGYDASGRATSTEHAGSVARFSTTYSTTPGVATTDVLNVPSGVTYRTNSWTAPVGTSLTTPLGASLGMTTTTVLGKTRIASQTQPAGSGSAIATSSQTYDANGNVASIDDFRSIRSCYVYDLPRNLMTTAVEGLATSVACGTVTPSGSTLPAGSRKTSTTWHPDWRLPVGQAMPGMLVTNVYNGQPDPFNGGATLTCAPSALPSGKPIAVLCKRVEQATTDTDGHLGFSATLQAGVANRVYVWTYNADGKVLTARGPRTDVDTTVSYAYYATTTADHTMGDLQTITNALGQVTTFGKYDPYGNVLESTDPNGVLTVNTYDLRQRLLTSTVGGEATSYIYDLVGQLKRITAPDASWVGFEYDAAHRLTAVLDNQNNRAEYTLDNAGNRIAENVKDPAGTLKRTLTRSADLLGRIKQVNGRP